MRKREAEFGLLFRHWIKKNGKQSGPYELKFAPDGKSMKFTELKEEQANFLLAAKSSKGVLIRVIGGSGEPDYAYYRNSPAWVVIRYAKFFVIIDIEDFIFERDRGGKRRSLTGERAREIAHTYQKIGDKR